MSRTSIPGKVLVQLWIAAGGRCQYDGCNEALWRDDLAFARMNRAYIAHIIADEPRGPRGHPTQSRKLAKAFSNLMLMCDAHHRLIDREDVASHPVSRLTQMKRKHEHRIELLTSLKEEKRSLVVLYGAKIGEHDAPLSFDRACAAMSPTWYPAESSAIELGMRNTSPKDDQEDYWLAERGHLRYQFAQYVTARLARGEAPHLSVFAVAPQPLLIELGRLLSDIPAAEIFQLHREPQTWSWLKHEGPAGYTILPPRTRHKCVAINLSLSATIENARISRALDVPHSVWTVTLPEPHNDFLRSQEQLRDFRECFRRLLDRVQALHGADARIHLFPAVPVAVAIEIGRVWMPKANLPMTVYDQNRKRNGFIRAIEIAQD